MSDFKKELTLKKLIQEVINEVGDLTGIHPYKYTFFKDIHAGIFTTSDKDEVSMFVEDITDYIKESNTRIPPVFKQTGKGLEEHDDIKVFQIAFNVEDSPSQYRKTDIKQLYKILKTVLEFVKRAIPDVLQQHGDKTIFAIGSQAKDTLENIPSAQKDALYRAIILQNLPSGFRTAELNISGKSTILFQKK